MCYYHKLPVYKFFKEDPETVIDSGSIKYSLKRDLIKGLLLLGSLLLFLRKLLRSLTSDFNSLPASYCCLSSL